MPKDQITRRPSDRRDSLLQAAVEILDEMPLTKTFSGATTTAVAERAGVTTGSFFHHFSDAAEFADALALSFLEPPSDVEETIEELIPALDHIDLIDMVHSSLTDTWQIFMSDDAIRQRFRVLMHLWAHHGCELSRPVEDLRTAGDILGRSFAVRQDEATSLWARVLEQTGRTVVPPFTLDRLGAAMTSLFQGLVIRAEVDPASVDDTLFADVASALAAALTVPLGSRLRLSDLTQPLRDDSHLSPQARSGARRRRETRARITAAASDMFTDGWEAVSASEVAERAGVSPQTVINLFGSVRRVAATVFARHTADIRRTATGTTGPVARAAEAGAPWVGERVPLDTLHATLVRLAECAAADREPARALLGERLETQAHRGGELEENDIRVEVPIADSVLYSLERLDLDGAEPIGVARMLIDFVLSQGVASPTNPAQTAELALRLLPPSAMAGHTDGALT